MKAWLLTLGFALLSFATSIEATFKKTDVEVIQLKNGLKVLLHEDHSIPNANMYTFWRVGSRNEVPGITGLSHFFEHMMFNGSKKYPPGSFDQVMEASGGSNNAYTSENVTVYTNWFTASAMPTIVDLEADRIASLKFDDKMIESERGVVLSERSTSLENNPIEKIYQTTKAMAFEAHPYRWPVIGYESDIKAWTKDDLIRYFETYYAPGNATMIITGDIKPAEIKKLLNDKIGSIDRPNTVPSVRTTESEQQGEKRVFVARASEAPAEVLFAYHAPETKHPDYYALDLLTEILSGGPSSRLRKLLVDELRLASSVAIDYSYAIDPTIFVIQVSAMDGKSPKSIEKATLSALENLIKTGVSSKELKKAQNKKMVDLYRKLETINGKAELLGNFEVFFGGYEQLFSASEAYAKVSSSDITRVLKTYFKKSNRTIGIQDQHETADASH